MPLDKSKSPKAFAKNVRTEMAMGKPKKMALAIAYSVAGQKKKAGEKMSATMKKDSKSKGKTK